MTWEQLQVFCEFGERDLGLPAELQEARSLIRVRIPRDERKVEFRLNACKLRDEHLKEHMQIQPTSRFFLLHADYLVSSSETL